MPYDIAGNQILAQPVSSFLQGRAIRRAEEESGARMNALQAAEGRAQGTHELEKRAAEAKFDEINGRKALAGAQQVLALPKGQRKAFVEKNFPEFVAKIQETAYGWDEADEDEVEEMAKGIAARAAADLGISPSAPDEYTLGRGEKRMRGGDVIAENISDEEEWTNPEAAVAGGREVMVRFNKRTGEPQIVPGVSPRAQKPLVQMGDQRFENAADRAAGEATGKAFGDVVDQGRMAEEELDVLYALRDNPAVTGPTQDLRASASALFADFGIPISEGRLNQIADLGAYKAAVTDLVLRKQLSQKGPQTESDAKRMRETLAQTKNLQETNRLVLNYQVALAERKRMRAQFFDEYRLNKGTVDGAEREWRSFIQSTPLSGYNKKTGRLVFFSEYVDGMQRANPEAGEDDILNHWRQEYGR